MDFSLLHTVLDLDARNASHVGNAALPDTSGSQIGVSEPSILALLGLGLVGFSFGWRQKT